MPNTGPNSPSTGVNLAGVGSTAWTTPAGITALDANFANAALSGVLASNYLVATGFGFSLPASATIQGVLADWYISSLATSANYSKLLAIGGAPVGTPVLSIWGGGAPTPGYESDQLSSAVSDLHGLTLTGADVNNVNFGVAIHFTAAQAAIKIDHVRVTLAYTLAASTTATYCTRPDVDAIWSEFGVTARLDDNIDGSADAGIFDLVLDKCATDINLYLMQRYPVATLQASPWVRWCCAVFAARDLARRRGNPVPPPLQAEYERYLEACKAIAANQLILPGVNGLSLPQFDDLPSVSNLTIDGRYHRGKIRRVPSTSTRAAPGDGVKRNDMVETPYWML